MLTPSLNTVMTRLLIVAAVLVSLMLVASASFAQESGEIEYTENGTDPVRTFVSQDPEGAGIDWDVTGLDADSFSIDNRGMLMFKGSPPNWENPSDGARSLNSDTETDQDTDFLDYLDADGELVNRSADTTDPIPDNIHPRNREFAGKDNRYQITIRATERSGETNRALSTEQHFTVVVMDADEAGTMTLDWIQPEVGTEITATLGDTDTVADDN